MLLIGHESNLIASSRDFNMSEVGGVAFTIKPSKRGNNMPSLSCSRSCDQKVQSNEFNVLLLASPAENENKTVISRLVRCPRSRVSKIKDRGTDLPHSAGLCTTMTLPVAELELGSNQFLNNRWVIIHSQVVLTLNARLL